MEHRTASRSRRAARMMAVAAAIPVMAATFQATPALGAPQAAPTQPAAAAPATPLANPVRADKKDRAVYFIHGYQRSGKADCKMWNKTKDYFKSQGWTGKLRTWAYYSGSKNCTARYSGSQNTDLKFVSRALAWDIYNNYTSKGKTVDVVAHSMGGIVIRNAIARVRRGHAGFPSKLHVEDVVTLGTPHDGSPAARLCGTTQCKQIRPSSSHLDWLNGLGAAWFQASGGTNWTLVGSNSDEIVNAFSATAFKGGKHMIRYHSSEGLDHDEYYKKGTGSTWTYYRSSDYGKTFKKYTNTGAGPIRASYLAAYYHSTR